MCNYTCPIAIPENCQYYRALQDKNSESKKNDVKKDNDNNDNNDQEILDEVINQIMEKTNPENIDIIESNQNPLYGNFQESEDKVLKIQKKYKKYQQEKNKPQFKNKIYSG